MRRINNEITDFEQLIKVLNKCQVCRLAMNNNGYPYIVPVNYGFEEVNGKLYIYIHGANAGMKKELIQKDRRVAFEMDYNEDIVIKDKSCDSYMNYVSICGIGDVSFVEEKDKVSAFEYIMRHYTDEPVNFMDAAIAHTLVLKIEVKEITGKFLKH